MPHTVMLLSHRDPFYQSCVKATYNRSSLNLNNLNRTEKHHSKSSDFEKSWTDSVLWGDVSFFG